MAQTDQSIEDFQRGFHDRMRSGQPKRSTGADYDRGWNEANEYVKSLKNEDVDYRLKEGTKRELRKIKRILESNPHALSNEFRELIVHVDDLIEGRKRGLGRNEEDGDVWSGYDGG